MVDPKDWGIALEHPELNTTECCLGLQHCQGYSTCRKGNRNNWPRTSMLLSLEI